VPSSTQAGGARAHAFDQGGIDLRGVHGSCLERAVESLEYRVDDGPRTLLR
jgi:hypothetical protein